eukprot:775678-Lingulodinium_polyedra.AAC.1
MTLQGSPAIRTRVCAVARFAGGSGTSSLRIATCGPAVSSSTTHAMAPCGVRRDRCTGAPS